MYNLKHAILSTCFALTFSGSLWSHDYIVNKNHIFTLLVKTKNLSLYDLSHSWLKVFGYELVGPQGGSLYFLLSQRPKNFFFSFFPGVGHFLNNVSCLTTNDQYFMPSQSAMRHHYWELWIWSQNRFIPAKKGVDHISLTKTSKFELSYESY